MMRPPFATATDIEGIVPLLTASTIVARTGSNCGFGTVACWASAGAWKQSDERRKRRHTTGATAGRLPLTFAGAMGPSSGMSNPSDWTKGSLAAAPSKSAVIISVGGKDVSV